MGSRCSAAIESHQSSYKTPSWSDLVRPSTSFHGRDRVAAGKLVDGRAKHDHDEIGSGLLGVNYSAAPPEEAAMNSSLVTMPSWLASAAVMTRWQNAMYSSMVMLPLLSASARRKRRVKRS